MSFGPQFTLGPFRCVTHMGGCTCPDIGLAVVSGDGPNCLLELRKLLQSDQPIGKCLRCDIGYSILTGGITH